MKILAIRSPLSCEFDLSIFLHAGCGEGGGNAAGMGEDRQTQTARGVFSVSLCHKGQQVCLGTALEKAIDPTEYSYCI